MKIKLLVLILFFKGTLFSQSSNAKILTLKLQEFSCGDVCHYEFVDVSTSEIKTFETGDFDESSKNNWEVVQNEINSKCYDNPDKCELYKQLYSVKLEYKLNYVWSINSAGYTKTNRKELRWVVVSMQKIEDDRNFIDKHKLNGEYKLQEGNCTPFCKIEQSNNSITLKGISYSGSTKINYEEEYILDDTIQKVYRFKSNPQTLIRFFDDNRFGFLNSTKSCYFNRINNSDNFEEINNKYLLKGKVIVSEFQGNSFYRIIIKPNNVSYGFPNEVELYYSISDWNKVIYKSNNGIKLLPSNPSEILKEGTSVGIIGSKSTSKDIPLITNEIIIF